MNTPGICQDGGEKGFAGEYRMMAHTLTLKVASYLVVLKPPIVSINIITVTYLECNVHDLEGYFTLGSCNTTHC